MLIDYPYLNIKLQGSVVNNLCAWISEVSKDTVCNQLHIHTKG